MGLDVYLYPRADAEANKLHDEASEAFYGRKDYDRLSEDEKQRLRDAIPPYVPQEDVPSSQYPDHLFNRRYLRSSYNGGGFNRAVPDFVGEDHGLYWIFEPMGREWDGDDGHLIEDDLPKLRESRKRAEQVADELSQCDPLRVMTESPILGPAEHMWNDLPDEASVLAWYREEKARHADRESDLFGESYSNARGLVLGFTKGVEVLAVTMGRDCIGRPSAAVVYRPDSEAVASYIQSAEIVCEFIDEAIGLIERDGSVTMSWSG